MALIGGELEQLPAAGKAALAQLQAEFGERVEVVGFTNDVPGWLARTTLVIGAGRVAIEALGAGRPVLALGEASYAGLVTEATFEAAAASNFGDISAAAGPLGSRFCGGAGRCAGLFASPATGNGRLAAAGAGALQPGQRGRAGAGSVPGRPHAKGRLPASFRC